MVTTQLAKRWLTVALLYIIFWYFCWNILEPDFGWHLVSGDYFRQHWVPLHDIFTYTAPGFAWIDHEWGSDVLTSVLYQLGGYALLTTVFAGIWTAAICLFRRRMSLGVLLAAQLAILPYMAVRPVAWTVLLMALLLELVQRTYKSNWQPLVIFPLIFLLWANLHAGFISGLAVLGYFCLIYRQKLWWSVLLLSAAVTLINPYGLRLYIEIGRTMFDPALHAKVTEWSSFHLTPKTWPIIVIWAVAFGLFIRRRLSPQMGVAAIMLLASISATRNVPLFVVAALRDLDIFHQDFVKLPSRIQKLGRAAVIGFATIALTSVFIVFAVNHFRLTSAREARYPHQSVAYLQQHPCTGNVFNHYDFGGYLIWKLPGTKVYIDGRMPSWRDANGRAYMEHMSDIMSKPAAIRQEFAQYDIRCAVLTPGDEIAVDTLKADHWQQKTQSTQEILLVKPASLR